MHDTLLMRRIQAGCDALGNGECLSPFDRAAAAHHFRKRLAIEILHREECDLCAVFRAAREKVENSADIRMRDTPGQLDLIAKTRQHGSVRPPFRPYRLQRYG